MLCGSFQICKLLTCNIWDDFGLPFMHGTVMKVYKALQKHVATARYLVRGAAFQVAAQPVKVFSLTSSIRQRSSSSGVFNLSI